MRLQRQRPRLMLKVTQSEMVMQMVMLKVTESEKVRQCEMVMQMVRVMPKERQFD